MKHGIQVPDHGAHSQSVKESDLVTYIDYLHE